VSQAMDFAAKIWKSVWEIAKSKTATNVVLFLAIPLIGLLDGLGEGKIRLNAFFLIPIMLITWRMGRRPGFLATIAALVILVFVSVINNPLGADSVFFAIDAIGRFISFFIIVFILSELRRSFLAQKTNAIKDPLTHLYNRFGFREILSVELENSRRNGFPFLLLYLDCDNFKDVNDQLGHAAGDRLLQTVAMSIVESIRRSDFACRLGGDEFVVFAGRISENDSAYLTEKIRKNLYLAMKAQDWGVTVSIGAAIFESAPKTVDEMIAFADSLMYDTKRSGKNGIRFTKWRDAPEESKRACALTAPSGT